MKIRTRDEKIIEIQDLQKVDYEKYKLAYEKAVAMANRFKWLDYDSRYQFIENTINILMKN